MQCTRCQAEFSPMNCPKCGAAITGDVCPACTEGGTVTCPGCGQKYTVNKAPAAQAPIPPQQPAAAPPPPAGEAPPPAPGAQVPPQGGAYTPPQGGAYTPPPQGGSYTPLQGGAYVPPPYGQPGAVPPPGAPYGQPLPTTKVPLGGWLTIFFVLNAIGLGYSALTLVMSLTGGTFSVFSLATSLIFNILPAVMILYYILQRDLKFRGWYIFTAVVSIAMSLLMAIAGIGFGAMDPQMLRATMEQAYAALPEYAALLQSLPAETWDMIIPMAMAICFIMAAVGIAYAVAWLVYFFRSKRVKYTFDPRNNPPKN